MIDQDQGFPILSVMSITPQPPRGISCLFKIHHSPSVQRTSLLVWPQRRGERPLRTIYWLHKNTRTQEEWWRLISEWIEREINWRTQFESWSNALVKETEVVDILKSTHSLEADSSSYDDHAHDNGNYSTWEEFKWQQQLEITHTAYRLYIGTLSCIQLTKTMIRSISPTLDISLSILQQLHLSAIVKKPSDANMIKHSPKTSILEYHVYNI